MKKQSVIFFVFMFMFFCLSAAFAVEMSSKKIKSIVESAVFSPFTAFPDAKTLYIETNIKNEVTKEEKHNILYMEGDKLRFDNDNKEYKTIYLDYGKWVYALYEHKLDNDKQVMPLFAAIDLDYIQVSAEKFLYVPKLEIEYVGTKKIEGKDCYVFRQIESIAGQNVYITRQYYIDKENSVVMKYERIKGEQISGFTVMKTEEIQGKIIPVKIKVENHKDKLVVDFNVKVDVSIDNEIFDKESVKEKWQVRQIALKEETVSGDANERLIAKAVLYPEQSFPDAKTLHLKIVSGRKAEVINIDAKDKNEEDIYLSGNRIAKHTLNGFDYYDGKGMTYIFRDSQWYDSATQHFLASDVKARERNTFFDRLLRNARDIPPKYFVSSDKAAKDAMFFRYAKNYKFVLGKITEERTIYEKLGVKEVEGVECEVIKATLLCKGEDSGFETQQTLLYFVDVKKNIIMKLQSVGCEVIDKQQKREPVNDPSVKKTITVKKIQKIDNKYVPVVIEEKTGDGNYSYSEIYKAEVSVNKKIKESVFDVNSFKK